VNFALLPVKSPSVAKARLAGVLGAGEREKLARLMFRATLRVLLACRGVQRVVVASSDEPVLAEAAEAGAWVIREATQNGHSDSADRAARQCAAWGATTLLMAPIDVPLLAVRDVEAALDCALQLAAPRLVIVPSADGTGTNALVHTPPGVIASRFGPDSFAAHRAHAQAAGVAVEVARPPGLVFDLDTPGDVAEYLAGEPVGPVADFLRGIGAAERVRAFGRAEARSQAAGET
jgi:2-phospho-L-lactate/phosphoenolpyruvate guanylyltransferase